jgi:hypothetical protein
MKKKVAAKFETVTDGNRDRGASIDADSVPISKKRTVKKKAAPKKTPVKKSAPAHDGSKVGYEAKCKEDVKWSARKVAFFKALQKIGTGSSAQIAEASKGAINAGHARHFGYHGVAAALVKVEQHEGTRGFSFTLTAAGRKVDGDKELAKQSE